ncbi:hypothetical protein LSAT2_022621 [Lamellibrachia satsuma]|nr:hypothetical protein LSAT2_022621 [Lamellibrachia satsuma]
MPAGFNNGEVTFRCGVIDHSGTFIFQMLETPGGAVLTESDVMYVKWPKFTMVLPETYEVLTDDVSLHFQIGGARCDSAHSGTTFWLQLVYYGTNVSWSSNDVLPVPLAQVIKRQNFTTFTNIHNVELIFECRLFDRAGTYQMLFRAGPEQHDLVAYSNQMRVTPSIAYSLETLSPSIYPCQTEIRIQYSQPKCSGNDDKVRLYKQIPQAESSIASPINLIYVTEMRAQKHRASVVFECGLFASNVIGYCFMYMSTAQNGAVVEQKRVCIPTKNYSGEI